MTDKPTDAVAQAREAVREQWAEAVNERPDFGGFEASVDALIAAVRAECAAKVENWVLDRIAALGPQPGVNKSDAARYAWAGKATAYDAMLAHVTSADVDQLASPEAQP